MSFFVKYGYTTMHYKTEGARHGILIAFPGVFQLISHEIYNYPNSTQQMIKLKFRYNDTEFSLITTHLKAKSPFADVRSRQVHFLLSHCYDEKTIVCGDFNASSPEYCIMLMLDDDFSSAYSIGEPTTCRAGTSTGDGFHVEPTAKRREQLIYKTIDYIFYKGVNLTNTNQLPSLEESPNEKHPSDHFPLCAEFSLN